MNCQLIFKDIFNLFCPERCYYCEKELFYNEMLLCVFCRHSLPLTGFEMQIANAVEKRFYARLPLEAATSFLYYRKKGITQKLIHLLKYKGRQHIGVFIGNWMAIVLKKSGRFDGIDYIVPVPLHADKQKKRGYNQLTRFGQSLSDIMEIPYVEGLLLRKKNSKTQTKTTHYDRWENVCDDFYLTDYRFFEKKHLLVVDDVITTGATIEACCNALLKTPHIKLSVATMAIAV